MSLFNSITQKILFDVSAKTDKAEDEFKSLRREVDKSADAIKRHGQASEGMFSKVAGGLATLGLSVEGVKKTFEIAGKGLDAYAKTSKSAAEEVAKIKHTADDAFGAVQVAIGKTVVALGPLIEGLGAVVTKLAEIAAFSAGGLEDVLSGVDPESLKKNLRKYGLAYDRKAGDHYLTDAYDNYQGGGGSFAIGVMQGAARRAQAQQDAINKTEALSSRASAAAGALRAKRNRPGGSGPSAAEIAEARAILGSAYTDWTPGSSKVSDYSLGASADTAMRDEFGREIGLDTQGPLNAIYQQRADMLNARDAARAERQTSFLASTFGELEEFNGYKMAFDTLSGAVSASLSAWVDGSMSAGQAFKKFVADSVKAIGLQMAMEALKHGAYAIGSLAFGDVRGAATHGKAAILHAAGAAAALGAAKALGGAGASAPGGASPGAPNTAVGGGAPAQQSGAPVIVYGDSFAYNSPREQQRTARRVVKQAIGTNGVTYA